MSFNKVHGRNSTTRTAYVQQNWCGGGIGLDDLRELVAATEDFDKRSKVSLSTSNVTVTEHLETHWFDRSKPTTPAGSET